MLQPIVEVIGGVGMTIIGLAFFAMLPALYRKMKIETESHQMWMEVQRSKLEREERGFE